MPLRPPLPAALLLLCVLLSSSSLGSAFLPPSPAPFGLGPRSTSARGPPSPSSFRPLSPPPPAPLPFPSPTALGMNLFDRFLRVTKSNVNNVLKSLEDPEKIMTQAVEDMQSDLVKVRQSYAEVTAGQRRLEKQRASAASLEKEWYGRAQAALKAGDEELAKEALTRRQAQVEQGGELGRQMELQTASMDKLYEGMKLLEGRINESKAKKDQMVARARTAASTKKVNDMLSGVTGKESTDAFSRMEEKVEMMEASAEVSQESAALEGSGGSLEGKFKALEAGQSVDSELEKMKQGLLGGAGGGEKKMLGGDASVDEELEKLRKEQGL